MVAFSECVICEGVFGIQNSKCGILNENTLSYLSHRDFGCKAAITVQLVLVFAMVDSVFRKVTLVFAMVYQIHYIWYFFK